MADLQLYTTAYNTIDNVLLTETSEIEINKNPNLNIIATLAKGFAGADMGAAQCEITIRNFIPAADFEFMPDGYLRTGRAVEYGCVMAGRQMQSKMFISNATYSKGVGNPAVQSLSLIGPLTDWE
jgi:hypothetical protein